MQNLWQTEQGMQAWLLCIHGRREPWTSEDATENFNLLSGIRHEPRSQSATFGEDGVWNLSGMQYAPGRQEGLLLRGVQGAGQGQTGTVNENWSSGGGGGG